MQVAEEARDEVARALRPEQLDRARTAVERWRPEPLDAGANAVDVPKEWLDGGAALADSPKPVGDVRLIQGGKESGTGRAAAAGGAGAPIAVA